MKTHFLAAAAVAGLTALATSAHAVPIAAGSTLSLRGNDTFTSTSIDFVSSADIGSGTLSFAALAPFPCVGCATMIGTTFTAASPPATLYTGHNAANTILTDLKVTSALFTFVGGALPNLTVTGAGTLDLTGFDPTPGSYILTTQGPNNVTVTFSVTSIAAGVPEPASLAILGSALAGLGLFGRKRRKAA